MNVSEVASLSSMGSFVWGPLTRQGAYGRERLLISRRPGNRDLRVGGLKVILPSDLASSRPYLLRLLQHYHQLVTEHSDPWDTLSSNHNTSSNSLDPDSKSSYFIRPRRALLSPVSLMSYTTHINATTGGHCSTMESWRGHLTILTQWHPWNKFQVPLTLREYDLCQCQRARNHRVSHFILESPRVFFFFKTSWHLV